MEVAEVLIGDGRAFSGKKFGVRENDLGSGFVMRPQQSNDPIHIAFDERIEHGFVFFPLVPFWIDTPDGKLAITIQLIAQLVAEID